MREEIDNAMVIRLIFRGGGGMISAWHSSLSEEKKDTVGGTQESKLLLYGQILAGRNSVATFIPLQNQFQIFRSTL